jgi:hypothetical protein
MRSGVMASESRKTVSGGRGGGGQVGVPPAARANSTAKACKVQKATLFTDLRKREESSGEVQSICNGRPVRR